MVMDFDIFFLFPYFGELKQLYTFTKGASVRFTWNRIGFLGKKKFAWKTEVYWEVVLA